MVCVLEESEALCIVRNLFRGEALFTVKVPGSTSVRDFMHQVASHFQYKAQNIELVLTQTSGEDIVLKESSDETLQGSGVRTDGISRNLFVLQPLQIFDHRSHRHKERNVPEEELNLGASASPTTTGDYTTYHIPPPAPPMASQGEYPPYTAGLIKQDTGYVGLVNQAMTCYLNSLLQALYMTPEFRNALYKWQYDANPNQSTATKCIPYQLQRLFLNLQTSTKTAVETTELTRSFGWDSSEAWQQHDIQELCRVMFDALEHVFKDTNQADLIDRLYQGKMTDYVKCLECSKEKSREDTFLDIPLPVRPFGSTVAYGSVVEALRAFVQPETLEGTNQYFCEKCAKKCDAHKGLKFTKFPYLLTLHLKRFDFDYNTMHRIKLNDKVTFPEILDLNSFIEVQQEKEEGSEGIPDELTVSKCDDSSTTDSGSALDDEGCQGTSDLPPPQDVNQEDDEGIDVSGSSGSNHHENEKNRRHGLPKGPYMYELFSIMIHSGSASGGHYYAYIKDFANGEWFCFNDTSVTRINSDDIAKTHGGGALRGYYSGAYSSSTNAYMLMYRQINESVNCDAMKVDDFPEHIKILLQELHDKQESDRRLKERHSEMTKLKVYCQHPSKGITDVKIYAHNDSSLLDVTTQAYEALNLDDLVELTDCRIVSYISSQECIEESFDGSIFLSEILGNLKDNEMFLEIKNKDDEFQVYKPGGVTVKAYLVDLEKDDVEPSPISIRTSLSASVADLKHSISQAVELNPNANIQADNMVLVMEKYTNDYKVLEDDSVTLQDEGLYSPRKVFVCSGPLEKPFINSKLHTFIDRFEHVITLHLCLPDTDPDTLARMSIPSLNSVQTAVKQAGDPAANQAEKVAAEPVVTGKSCRSRGLMLPLILTGGGDEESGGVNSGCAGGGHSDQSTSEDSSLTDSDRTLIGDVQDECLSDGDNQLASPPDEKPIPLPAPGDENLDEELANMPPTKQYTYFKSFPSDSESDKLLKIQVDKRMSIDMVKSCLEVHVGVPASCFKLYRSTGTGDTDNHRASRPCDSLSGLKSEDSLVVRLGRQLTSDEHRLKVHQLVLNSSQPVKYLCEWIVAKGGTVGQTKREILEDVNKKNNLSLEYDKCRLRKKNWKNVGRVYLDSQLWIDDIMVYSNGDIFLQELPELEPVTSTSQLCLFVRHWHPSTLTLDPFHEIVLNGYTIEELKEKLSQHSNILLENLEFAKPTGLFPCEMSVLSIHTELEWNPKAVSLEGWPLQFNEDGGVIFYRDSQEELKTLTQAERVELNKEESARLSGSSGTISSYSSRKERPLKIYLEKRPCFVGEADVD